MEASVSATDLLQLLNGKFSSLTISFNEDHAPSYETAQEWHDRTGRYRSEGDDQRINWVSEAERLKAISENAVWTIQWYPQTPNGFYCVGASSFEAAARFALEVGGAAKTAP